MGIAIALAVATLLLSGPGHAGSDPTKAQATPQPIAPADAPLVLSIRSLAVSPMTFTDGGQVEAASTHVGRGVYISVTPGCIPGVDEPLWPGAARRRR
jgi:hypothetical protein